jgi:hypothetical protein
VKSFPIKQSTIKNILILAILTTIVLFVIDLLVYGPGISGDTAGYLSLAGDVYIGKAPSSPSYLPGFPLLVGLTAKISSIKIVQAVSLWIGIFYILNLIYIGKTTHYLNKTGKITTIGSYFLFFILISWWSFRIQKATHADAMYYSLLIVFSHYLIKAFQENKSKYFLITGFVLAIMAVTKYNSYVLLLILGLVIIIRKIDFKQKIIFLIFSLVPAFLMIVIWKLINGGFIYALKLNNYENSQNNTQEILDTFYQNISQTGNELIETFINPIFARYINLDFGFFIGFSLIAVLFLALYTFRKSQQEIMFLLFASVYLISVIVIQSLNMVAEINIRTLITLNLYLFLFLGIYILKNNLKILGGILFILLFTNNVLVELKWLTETSKNNSFKYEYAKNNQFVITDTSFIKSIEDKEVVSNVAESIMFHLNYQKHINKFNSNRIFRKGKFLAITPEILKQISEKLKLVIEKGGIVIFSNKMTINDKKIYNDLVAHNYYSKNYNDLVVLSKVN